MAIRLVVTRGYGNGTFSGTIRDLVLRGYSNGIVIVTETSRFLTDRYPTTLRYRTIVAQRDSVKNNI